MSWYWIVLLVIFYIVMWIITAIGFSRWAKNSDPGWIALGMVWPLVLVCIPIVCLICVIVEKYAYKEDKK